MNQQFFAVRHTDSEIRQRSSSGGAFTAITDGWFSTFREASVVYGCVMDEHLKVKHIRAVGPLQRDAMRGSKYVGSNMSGIMRQVETDLENGKYVCFSGTPCQIAGLKSFLYAKGVEYGCRLLTVEVICHGVGSTRFFEDYIAYYEKRYKSRAVYCSFRGKTRPGKRQQMVIQFENGRRYASTSARYDDYLSAYGRNYILRPSCFQCPFAAKERYADISIGDYWSEAAENTSVRTLMIGNTPLGIEWIRRCEEVLQCQELTTDEADQPQLSRPSDRPEVYDIFWELYRREGYQKAQVFLGNRTALGMIRKAMAVVAYWLNLTELLKGLNRYIQKI